MLDWSLDRVTGYLRGLCSRSARKRRMTRHIFSRSALFTAKSIARGVFGNGSGNQMVFPGWYEN